MFKKNYPKTITLRKWIVGAVALLLSLICAYIFSNLLNHANANKKINFTETKDLEQRVATDVDTKWFKEAEMKKALLQSMPPQKRELPSAKKFTQEVKTDEKNISTPTPSPNQDLEKAMSASISSNQLTGDVSTVASSFGAVSLNDIPNRGNTEQHLSSEKNEFLNANRQTLEDDYLTSTLKNPISPFEVQSGTLIPGVLLTGINSDLPGQMTALVRANVYDSVTGNYLLIPQGSKLIGVYDAEVVYGQSRVLVAWKRIIFENGQSINLQGMPGIDLSGYAGFKDKVNNHYQKLFGSVVLMSILSSGAQLSQPQQSNSPFAGVTIGQTLAQSLGTNIANTGTQITAKNLNIKPTLEIRPGYAFNIMVTKDMVFPCPYSSPV